MQAARGELPNYVEIIVPPIEGWGVVLLDGRRKRYLYWHIVGHPGHDGEMRYVNADNYACIMCKTQVPYEVKKQLQKTCLFLFDLLPTVVDYAR